MVTDTKKQLGVISNSVNSAANDAKNATNDAKNAVRDVKSAYDAANSAASTATVAQNQAASAKTTALSTKTFAVAAKQEASAAYDAIPTCSYNAVSGEFTVSTTKPNAGGKATGLKTTSNVKASYIHQVSISGTQYLRTDSGSGGDDSNYV